MRRRNLIIGIASTGTLTAGCLGSPGDDPSNQTTNTEDDTSTTSPIESPPESELDVSLEALQSTVVELNTDRYELVTGSDRQFAVLAVSVAAGPSPSRSDLSFRFDGENYAPMAWDRIPARQETGSGDAQYSAENEYGWVVFELPETGDASDAALVWPSGEWQPGDQLRNQLSHQSPSLSVNEWQVPETVPLNSTTTFELTVQNDGDQTGWYVAAINAEGWYPHRPIAHISRQISPGETVSWGVPGEEIELKDDEWSDNVGDEQEDLHYELTWPDGTDEKSSRIIEE